MVLSIKQFQQMVCDEVERSSMNQLARKAGVSVPTIWRIVHEQKEDIYLGTASKIASAIEELKNERKK